MYERERVCNVTRGTVVDGFEATELSLKNDAPNGESYFTLDLIAPF